MGILRSLAAMALAVAACLGVQAQTPQPRIALVIGQGGYAAGALPTAINDAGLMAQALNDSGFEIVEGSDLDLSGMRRLIQEFLDRVEKNGPDTAAAVYISGYAAQLEGDNYLLPVDARVVRESDIAMAGFRLSDLIRSLNAATEGAKIVIIDTPRGYPALRGKTVASGLALIEPPRGMLIAYAAAPGNVLPDDRPVDSGGKVGNYGIYAQALGDQIYQPGIEADELFKRARMQVHGATAGVEIPWHGSALTQPFFFMAGQVQAPAPRPAEIVTPEDAYALAIETDTITGYQSFLKLYSDHALAKRIKVLLANRREAVFWSRTVSKGTAEAYWTYLKAYPKGPHIADARRRLEMLSRPVYPPEEFPVVIYRDIPPPIEIETVYETTYIYNDYRDYYDYPPPPPPPAYILPPLRPIPWQAPVKPERPGFLPTPPRPPVLPPPVWRDKPLPPRAAPIVPGAPVPGDRKPGMPVGKPDMGHKPPAALPRPVERPVPAPFQERPRPIERPVPAPVPGDRKPGMPVGKPDMGHKPPAALPRPVEHPAPAPFQERARPIERPVPAPVQERARPIERPVPAPVQERPRPIERPVPAPVQERPRPIERPTPAPVQERPAPQSAPPPARIERPAAPAPAPAVERSRRPEPQRPSGPSDKQRRPGELPQ